jgi:hypothetical protein
MMLLETRGTLFQPVSQPQLELEITFRANQLEFGPPQQLVQFSFALVMQLEVLVGTSAFLQGVGMQLQVVASQCLPEKIQRLQLMMPLQPVDQSPW